MKRAKSSSSQVSRALSAPMGWGIWEKALLLTSAMGGAGLLWRRLG